MASLGLLSSLFLIPLDGAQKCLRLWVGLKVPPHWLDELVDDLSDCRLEIVGVQISLNEVRLQFCVGVVGPE